MSHIANSNIRVDNFQYRQNDKTNYVYFLSHCHEDHLKGLSNNWSQGKIYASYCSKLIIVERFPNLKDFVIDLEMDEEHWIYLDEDKKDGVSVVLMDAFHCPGAVMFLFKGKMGSVLHTGDFRFDEQMLQNKWLCPPEKDNAAKRGISVDIDYLHLDNTFADPAYDFPPREEAYQGLVNIVKSHKQYRVFLFAYNLGKEEVFLSLADDFKTKIVVDEERMKKIKLMSLRPELFTLDQTESLFHIKSIKDLGGFDINLCNREMPTIFIILTGWNDKYNRNLPFYFKVPYSSHSNYRELERLVKAVNPRKLIFNVSDRNNTKRRHDFQAYLTKEYERGNKQQQVVKPIQSGPKREQTFNISAGMAGSSNSGSGLLAASHQILRQEDQANINNGYSGAVKDLSNRFDVNNRELNKKRFADQYAHIMQTSKVKGARFVNKEIKLSLTPPKEDFGNHSDQDEKECQSKSASPEKVKDLKQEASLLEIGDFLELESSSNSMKSNEFQALKSESQNSRRRQIKQVQKEQKKFQPKDLNIRSTSEEGQKSILESEKVVEKPKEMTLQQLKERFRQHQDRMRTESKTTHQSK